MGVMGRGVQEETFQKIEYRNTYLVSVDDHSNMRIVMHVFI